MRFKRIPVRVPNCDCDIVLQFPCGKAIIVQCRPSNADEGYEGSLDIVLPEDQTVTCWEGDEMKAAKQVSRGQSHIRRAKQLVLELPKQGEQTWTGCSGS